MGIWEWLGDNSFNLLSAVGIIGSLLFTALSFRADARTRRIANLIQITGSHHELWRLYMAEPGLERIFARDADLKRHAVRRDEELFVNLVIAHVNTVYYALQNELLIKPEGLRRDVAAFFSLPIPAAIWEKHKAVHNDDFVAFVQSCRQGKYKRPE